ncbi:MAG: hypothetical protein ACI9YT_000494 [Halobacteriales archaeon]|jgi:hypothetical protein
MCRSKPANAAWKATVSRTVGWAGSGRNSTRAFASDGVAPLENRSDPAPVRAPFVSEVGEPVVERPVVHRGLEFLGLRPNSPLELLDADVERRRRRRGDVVDWHP